MPPDAVSRTLTSAKYCEALMPPLYVSRDTTSRRFTGRVKDQMARAMAHMGQKRARFLQNNVRLNHDVLDGIVLTSHLINKDLLQREGQGVHQNGGVSRQSVGHVGGAAPYNKGVDAPHLGAV